VQYVRLPGFSSLETGLLAAQQGLHRFRSPNGHTIDVNLKGKPHCGFYLLLSDQHSENKWPLACPLCELYAF
jgi:hypothetical protein